MKKLDISKKKTGAFQGKKYLIFNKATRWPLLLGLLLVIIAGSAFAPGGSKPGDGTTRRKAKPVSTMPLSAPTLSYSGPHTYQQGQTISLAPTSSGVGAFGYATTATTYGSGFKAPSGVAADAAGNVYVADYVNGLIKIPAGNGTPATLPFASATQVAVDSKGNVYVVGSKGHPNGTDNYVWKFPAGTNKPILLYHTLDSSITLGVDAAGDVFMGENAPFDLSGEGTSSEGEYTLKEMPVTGNSFHELFMDQYGAIWPVTADVAGNPFFVEYNNLMELPAGSTTPVATGITFNNATGITFDAAGNFYGVDQQTGVLQIFAAGNFSGTPITLSQTFPNATGLAVDGTGAIYVSNWNQQFNTPGNVQQVKPTGGYFISPALPAGLSFDNNTGIISGTVTAASAATTYTVTAYNASGSTSATVIIKILDTENKADLASLKASRGVFSPAFSPLTNNYSITVANSVNSLQLTPVTEFARATVKINGTPVADSALSPPIPLAIGINPISIVVTAANGIDIKTYQVAVNRPGNSNAELSSLIRSAGVLSPVFSSTSLHYTTYVANGVQSITITPTAQDPGATISVNHTVVSSGSTSAPIALQVGATFITIDVLASDGVTDNTYTINVHRAPSSVDNLSSITLSAGTLAPAFAPATINYTVNEANTVSSITITPTAADPDATIKVNGTTVASGTASPAIPLTVGDNTIAIVVTAQDGTTTKTYTIVANRAASPGNIPDESLGVSRQPVSPSIEDGIMIHQGISPNGDGIDDYLAIDGIQAYPDNKLTIMNRNGQLIFEARGYDNAAKVFDGHSNKDGKMQLPGTYFYSLDYTVKGIAKHKTGFIVLRY